MKTLAEEMNSHTVGRANQLTYTVVNEMNEMSGNCTSNPHHSLIFVPERLLVISVNEVSQKVNSFLPGTSSLVEQLGAKILVCLRDGKTLIGELQSFDQFGNLVLSKTVERIIVKKLYSDKSVGTYILRGENIVLLGEIDPAKEAEGGLTSVSHAEIKKAQLESKEAVVDWSFLLDDM